MDWKYKLAEGTQVREEDFGLLFYTRTGPRLYFLPSGKLLPSNFFTSNMTLKQWMEHSGTHAKQPTCLMHSLNDALAELKEKGVIIEF